MEYTNEDPKQELELNDTDLGFLNSSNDIISGKLDEITPDHNKVSREIEPEEKRNSCDIGITEDGDKDTEEDKYIESGICSESG